MKINKFEELTKKEKLKIPFASKKRLNILEKKTISKVLFIPIRKKMDGYGCSAVFVESQTENKRIWDRLYDNDCFSFTTFSSRIKGDFEYGGVAFFLNKGSFDRFSNTFIKLK